MSRATQFLIAAVFLLSTSAAFAEDMKLGYVDMQRALNETEDGRKAKEKLKKDFDQKQKELDEQQNQLKKEIEDELRRKPGQRIFVKADADLTFGMVYPALIAIHEAGSPGVELGTQELKEKK